MPEERIIPFDKAREAVNFAFAWMVTDMILSSQLKAEDASEALACLLWQFHKIHENFECVAKSPHQVPTPRRGVPDAVRERIHARDGYACLKCGSTQDLQIDHIVSLDLGGLHAEENFQTLCGSCNSSKRTRAVDYRLD